MNSNKSFVRVVCAAFGMVTVLANIGCGQKAAGSSESGATAPQTQASAGATSANAAGIVADQMPVRIARGFFEQSLSAEVKIQGAAVESAVDWKEFPTTQAAPAPTAETGAVLADFRDHKGCATFKNAQGAELCFNIMGDVSNIGLNEREMQANGLGALIDQQLGQSCQGAEWNVRFVRGTRAQGSFTVTFSAEQTGAPQAGCSSAPVEVALTLKQI
jgi:hypothetical protein